jgi:coronin-7
VMAFEVSTTSPHFSQLSDFKADTPHLAVAFQPKIVCDVKAVEFARAVRLTNANIEPVTFAVPRVKV